MKRWPAGIDRPYRISNRTRLRSHFRQTAEKRFQVFKQLIARWLPSTILKHAYAVSPPFLVSILQPLVELFLSSIFVLQSRIGKIS